MNGTAFVIFFGTVEITPYVCARVLKIK